MHRDTYLKMTLDELLRACTLKGFQGSGPGGQHRNKTNTGVLLGLREFNLEIKSCEGRSAHENKVHALHRMQMALALQDVDLRKLSASEYLFLSKWWIPVVRALIEMNGGHAEVSHLVKQISPTVSEDQVREAITVLKDLKLITPLASERYAATTANFTSAGSATKTAAIRSYQNQLLALAQNSLIAVEPAKRNISSLLVGVDEDCFADLNEMTLEFRRQVQRRVAEVNKPTRAMQFVFALYPVADISNDPRTKKEG